jgi:hypothetical protein
VKKAGKRGIGLRKGRDELKKDIDLIVLRLLSFHEKNILIRIF